MQNRFTLALATLALPATVAAADVRVDYDRHKDFGRYRTFSVEVAELVRSDGVVDEQNTLAEGRLRQAVDARAPGPRARGDRGGGRRRRSGLGPRRRTDRCHRRLGLGPLSLAPSLGILGPPLRILGRPVRNGSLDPSLSRGVAPRRRHRTRHRRPGLPRSGDRRSRGRPRKGRGQGHGSGLQEIPGQRALALTSGARRLMRAQPRAPGRGGS